MKHISLNASISHTLFWDEDPSLWIWAECLRNGCLYGKKIWYYITSVYYSPVWFQGRNRMRLTDAWKRDLRKESWRTQ